MNPSLIRRTALLRVLPFVFFMAVLALRGMAPEDGSWGFDTRWLYALQAGGAALLLAWAWGEYGELARQNLPDAREWLLALATGLAVVALWIQLDAPWMTLSAPSAGFVPLDAHGQLEWGHVLLRIAGAALVVPVMEELFWRSFLMRWIQQPVFEGLDPRRVGPRAVVLSTFVFTLAHTLWLAAVIAGLVYAWLYIRTGKLWVAVVSHGVTNLALGIWVVQTRQWQFW